MGSSSDHEATEQQQFSVVTMSSDTLTESQYAQQLVQTYFRMLTVGCNDQSHVSSASEISTSSSVARCSNAYCKSNSSSNSKVIHGVSPTDAAILSVYLATQAPMPLCIPIVSYFPVPQQQEARPETDDDQEGQGHSPDHTSSTPRRRLSSAVELDLAFNISSHDKLEIRRPLDGRRLSLPKQKLLDAITKSFPGIAHRKQREVDLSTNNRSSEAGR